MGTVNWRERQLEEIRKRSNGHTTASYCLIAAPGAYPHIDVERHMLEVFIPLLCSAWGRVTP